MTSKTIVFHPPRYGRYYIVNGGMLPNGSIAAEACWHYYVTARGNYERDMKRIYLVGQDDEIFNYKDVAKSIALAYGVEPELMCKMWEYVDAQCTLLGTPKLPPEDRYRHTGSNFAGLIKGH